MAEQPDGGYNLIYNNFFNNTINTRSDFSYTLQPNFWNITKTLGENIVGGPYIAGNFWSDYTGEDIDNDGIGNTLLPYLAGAGRHCCDDSGNIIPDGDFAPLVIQKRVKGVDVSHHQGGKGPIDWTQVFEAGYRFAFVKATEGGTRPKIFIDSNFTINMDGGKNAGLLVGAYHFARPDLLEGDAKDEALFFINTTAKYLVGDYLRPVLDLENGSELGKENLTRWVHTWMDVVKNVTGIEPLIYVTPSFAKDNLDSSVTKYSLWIAHWTYDPNVSPDTAIWNDWDFWQWTNKSTISGINGFVDENIFNGSMEQLQTFLIPNDIDSDNDSVPNNEDPWPFDKDNDGVLDINDLCPFENPGILFDANRDGCKDNIESIVSTTQNMNLQQGISNSLDSKLQNAKDALDAKNAGNRNDAINKIESFKNEVEAQRGSKITNEQADLLIAMANNVIAQI